MCLNNHKTPELAEKVYELIDLIKKRTLNEIFEFKNFESLERKDLLPDKNKSNLISKGINSYHTLKKSTELIKISENNIENYQKGLIKDIFEEKNKKLFESKIQLNSRNFSSMRRNGISKRESELNLFNKRNSSENFNGRMQNIYRNYSNNKTNKTSLINKYKSILMSKKIKEEKSYKFNKDFSTSEIMNIDDSQMDIFNFDSSMLSVRENGSNLTNHSGFNQKMKYFSMKEDIDKKRKDYILQRKSKLILRMFNIIFIF